MAESPNTQDELHLRRRARRRLVGAIALALLAVVVLPMVLDPEPRPLGDQVDIRIPDQKTPFEPVPMLEPAAPVEPAEAPPVAPVEEPKPEPAKPVPPPEAKPQAKEKPAVKPEIKTKSEQKPPVAPTVSKPVPKAQATQAATGDYYLQLGVFSSQANASQLIAKAKIAGFKASSTAVGGQFKVRVGPIAERDRALDYQTKLKARGLDNVLLEP